MCGKQKMCKRWGGGLREVARMAKVIRGETSYATAKRECLGKRFKFFGIRRKEV